MCRLCYLECNSTLVWNKMKKKAARTTPNNEWKWKWNINGNSTNSGGGGGGGGAGVKKWSLLFVTRMRFDLFHEIGFVWSIASIRINMYAMCMSARVFNTMWVVQVVFRFSIQATKTSQISGFFFLAPYSHGKTRTQSWCEMSSVSNNMFPNIIYFASIHYTILPFLMYLDGATHEERMFVSDGCRRIALHSISIDWQ